ncbi:MAG: 23S rRNA (pseudouridine(1915)-N(3))-methyltransferase RlmH [Nitratireductor sp.]
MQLSILTIGKMKAGSKGSAPEMDLLNRYVERSQKAGRQLGFAGPKILEWNESRAQTAALRKEEEASQMLSSLSAGATLICLDERGKDISSEDLSQLMRRSLDNSTPQIAFAIGGPDGHADQMREQASHTIRFGKMTWPHQFARIMIAEQIYRAITILSNHPYHRV